MIHRGSNPLRDLFCHRHALRTVRGRFSEVNETPVNYNGNDHKGVISSRFAMRNSPNSASTLAAGDKSSVGEAGGTSAGLPDESHTQIAREGIVALPKLLFIGEGALRKGRKRQDGRVEALGLTSGHHMPDCRRARTIRPRGVRRPALPSRAR
jgi:hypothetical protein